MISENAYLFVQIGLCIRLLQNVSDAATNTFVLEVIETLTEKLEKANFNVSMTYMMSDTYQNIENTLNEREGSDKLGSELRKQVVRYFGNLEQTVFAEAASKKVYLLQSRRFSTEYLLNDPAQLFKKGAFAKLDDVAKSDIASSGRCLLFGEATAAAFHILRATESALRSYYCHHVKQKRMKTLMWGPMVLALQKKTRRAPPQALLTKLDLIRVSYRNPTQHPEYLYEVDGAQDLFGVCIDSIGTMCEELPQRN
jgi:hypothetical protein